MPRPLPHHCVPSVLVVLALVLVTGGAHAQSRIAINEREFALEVRWLDLDEQQTVIARALFEDYRRWLLGDHAPRVRAVGAPAPFEIVYEEWRKKHGDEFDRLMAERDARTEIYFGDLQSLLREEQRSLMVRVRLGRERFHWRVGREQLPGANVDLIELVEGLPLSELERRREAQRHRARLIGAEPDNENEEESEALPLELTGLPLGQGERERIDVVIAEFEPGFIAALRAATLVHRRFWEKWNKGQEIRLRIEQDGGELDPKERARLERRQYGYWDQASAIVTTGSGRAARRNLLELNERALEQFKASLSKENAEILQRRYLELSYPEVYPDPGSAIRLYDAAEALNDLDEAQREMLAVLRARFVRQHKRLSDEMAAARMRAMSVRSTTDRENASLSFLKAEYEFGIKREGFNQEQTDLIRARLLPAQGERLPEWDFEKNPPPRPWDPSYKPGKPRATNKPAPRDDH